MAADLVEAAGRGAEGGVLSEGVVAARRLGLKSVRLRRPIAILRRRPSRGLLLRQQLRRSGRRRLDLPGQLLISPWIEVAVSPRSTPAHGQG